MDDDLMGTIALALTVIAATVFPIIAIIVFEAYHRRDRNNDDHREHP